MNALVIGGAGCVWDDLRALGPFSGTVVAVNDIGAYYPHRFDHWATLHPEKLAGWRMERWRRGGNGDYTTWSRRNPELVDHILSGWSSGSSGMLGVGVALEMGAEHVTLAGVPMGPEGHFFDPAPWEDCMKYREAWEKRADALRGRVASMSGWTRNLLGGPELQRKGAAA